MVSFLFAMVENAKRTHFARHRNLSLKMVFWVNGFALHFPLPFSPLTFALFFLIFPQHFLVQNMYFFTSYKHFLTWHLMGFVCFCFVLFLFFGVGAQTQGFTGARQTLYHRDIFPVHNWHLKLCLSDVTTKVLSKFLLDESSGLQVGKEHLKNTLNGCPILKSSLSPVYW